MATDLDLQYIISADSAKLSTGMAESQKIVSNATAGMAASTKAMEEQTASSTAGIAGLFSKMASSIAGTNSHIAESSTHAAESMSGGFKNAVSGITGSMGGLGKVFEEVSSHLLLLGGVLAGGAAFKEAIDATNKWNGEAGKLSKQLGVSTQDASMYMVAMHKFGIEADTLGVAVQKVAIQTMKGGQGFKTMGIDVKDATGQFRPAMDIIAETNEKIKEIHNPILQAQAGISAYGKSWADIKPLLKLTSEELEEAKSKMKALNLEVSPENVAASKKYKENMNEFKLALEALSINIGQAVLPAFSKLAGILAEVAIAVVSHLRPAFDILAAAFEMIMPILKGFWSMIEEIGTDIKESFASAFHEVFGEEIPGDIDYLAGVVNAFKTFFIGFKIGMLEAFEAIKMGVAILKDEFVTWATVANKALHLDFDGAKAAIATGVKAIENDLSSSMDRMAKIAQDGAKEIDNVWNGVAKPKKAVKETQDVDPSLDFSKQKNANLVKDFESELTVRKEHYETTNALEGHFIEFSKEMEASFWKEKLSLVEKGSNDYKAIEMKIAKDRIEITKKSFETELANLKAHEAEYKTNTDKKLEYANEYLQKVTIAYGKESSQYVEAQHSIVEIKRLATEQLKQVDEIRVKTAQEHNLQMIADEMEMSKLREELGIQSNIESINQEQGFEDRIFGIKSKALDDQLALALLNPDKNIVEIAKLNAELETLESQHQAKLQAIRHKSTLAQNKDIHSVMTSFQSGMAGAIKSVANGTATIGGAMRTFMVGMVNAVIGALADMAAAWLTQKITEMIVGKTAGVSGVASNAAIAGAAATASAAAIPMVGWMMAPEAGAAAFAAAMAFGSAIPAAAKGFDIPQGVNPITQLHEKEMVLPARQADVIRDMADNGTGAGSVQLHVHATDAQSVKRLFENNGAALADVIMKQRRNFKL